MHDLTLNLPKGRKYVVAVSGGVDSMVLLELLNRQNYKDIIVAHFDHGIRQESQQDRIFVQRYCVSHNMRFIYEVAQLGKDASEDEARRLRYKFLRKILKNTQADAILTAHHKNDVLETAVLNLIRGTGRKGLSSLRSGQVIVRPLLEYTKEMIIDFAKKNDLKWCEDATNTDTSYLRNYIRHSVIPYAAKVYPHFEAELLGRINNQKALNFKINRLRAEYANKKIIFLPSAASIKRYELIMLPESVALEILQYTVLKLSKTQLQSKQVRDALLFIKTAKPHKIYQINKDWQIASTIQEVIVEPRRP